MTITYDQFRDALPEIRKLHGVKPSPPPAPPATPIVDASAVATVLVELRKRRDGMTRLLDDTKTRWATARENNDAADKLQAIEITGVIKGLTFAIAECERVQGEAENV